MNRRDFLKNIGATAGALALTGCVTPKRETIAPKTEKPTIIYILADDLGYGDVHCLNPEGKIPTPHMDRLAREGIVFTDAHSGSAVCTPTRYGVLTGRYSWRTRLKSGVLFSYDTPLMDPKRLNVASLLKTEGYRTACIGKWHLGLDWATTDGKRACAENVDYARPVGGGPTANGFDYFFGIPASLDMEPYLYLENDHVVAPPTGHIEGSKSPAFFRGGPIAPGFRHEDVLPALTGKAIETIDRHAAQHADAPLFLYFPLSAPHAPIVPSGDFQGVSGLNVYGDFVCQVDWAVGQVLDAVERNGMAHNALIIVTSDNGCSPEADFGQLHGMGHHPSYHFRGHKADIFEGGHRIPFLARWPERVPPGSTCGDTVCLTDLMATAAEIVGRPLPDNAGEDSVSMLPALMGCTPRAAREAIVHHSINGSFSIRAGRWKLALCPGSGGWSKPRPKDPETKTLPPVQLYDLQTDVAETRNVQKDHPEIVERLTRLLEKYISEGRSSPGTPQQNEGKTSPWGPPAS